MSGGHIFVSFQRFMEGVIGVDGSKLDDITAAVSEISGAVGDITPLHATISEISQQIENIEFDVDGVEALLTSIDADTSGIALSVDGVEALLATIDADTSAMNTALAAIDTNVADVEALLTTIDADTSAINTNVADIEALITTLDAAVDTLSATASELALQTERNSQNAGGQLLIAEGRTSGTTTTITPSPAPGAGESIRIRFAYFTVSGNPFPITASLGFHLDNSSGAEIGFTWEMYKGSLFGPSSFELGDWFHEITTASFRIRRTTGGSNVNYYIGYTIQDTEGTLP